MYSSLYASFMHHVIAVPYVKVGAYIDTTTEIGRARPRLRRAAPPLGAGAPAPSLARGDPPASRVATSHTLIMYAPKPSRQWAGRTSFGSPMRSSNREIDPSPLRSASLPSMSGLMADPW